MPRYCSGKPCAEAGKSSRSEIDELENHEVEKNRAHRSRQRRRKLTSAVGNTGFGRDIGEGCQRHPFEMTLPPRQVDVEIGQTALLYVSHRSTMVVYIQVTSRKSGFAGAR